MREWYQNEDGSKGTTKVSPPRKWYVELEVLGKTERPMVVITAPTKRRNPMSAAMPHLVGGEQELAHAGENQKNQELGE